MLTRIYSSYHDKSDRPNVEDNPQPDDRQLTRPIDPIQIIAKIVIQSDVGSRSDRHDSIHER